MLNSIFDKVFLINLDRRPDRLKICDDWFKSQNIDYERIVAVDGKEMDGESVRKNAELGCKLSHLKAIQLIIDRGYKNAVVLEDDFDPVEDFLTKFVEAAKWVPADWMQLYFGGNHQHPLRQVNDYVAQTKGTATTHAYALRGEYCPTLADVFKFSEPVDTIYRVMHLRVPAYTFKPHLINQKAGYSDIIDDESNYDFMR